MIIDSHAHYAHKRYNGEFPCICETDSGYVIIHTDREGLFSKMKDQGIVGSIEVSIGLDNVERQLELVSDSCSDLYAAIGVHPTRCIHTEWEKRLILRKYALENSLVAIGETGLDYHYKRKDQHRLRQIMWFVYQVKLADKLALPLILHIRDADKSVLKILNKYKSRLHGGVIHCFCGDIHLARKYIELGFALGIGTKILGDDKTGRELRDVVCDVPLSSLLVETDAPFLLPDIDSLSCSRNQRKKLCNSSLILGEVIRKIAEIRRESYEAIEDAIYYNTLRVFRL